MIPASSAGFGRAHAAIGALPLIQILDVETLCTEDLYHLSAQRATLIIAGAGGGRRGAGVRSCFLPSQRTGARSIFLPARPGLTPTYPLAEVLGHGEAGLRIRGERVPAPRRSKTSTAYLRAASTAGVLSFAVYVACSAAPTIRKTQDLTPVPDFAAQWVACRFPVSTLGARPHGVTPRTRGRNESPLLFVSKLHRLPLARLAWRIADHGFLAQDGSLCP